MGAISVCFIALAMGNRVRAQGRSYTLQYSFFVKQPFHMGTSAINAIYRPYV